MRVPYIQYSSTASTSTEYDYPTPGCRNVLCKQGPVSISDKTSYREASQRLEGVRLGLNICIALDFDRHIGSSTTENPVIFQSDQAILNTNLVASRLLFRFLSPLQSILQCTLSISRCFFLLRCFHWERLIFCHTLSLIAISRMAFRDIHCTTGLDDWVVNTCDGSFTFSDNL